MKKEDLIIGKWYHNPNWGNKNFKAIKVTRIDSTYVYYNENISYDKYNNQSKENKTINIKGYKEVPISEIAQYLPKDHPDLQYNIPEYVKCTKNQGNSEYKIGIIYKIISATGHIGENIGTAVWSYNKHRFVPATKEEYEAQSKSNELKEFPLEGYCKNKSKDLAEYLKKRFNPYENQIDRDYIIGYAWNSTNYWYISVSSTKQEYTIEQLNKFINPLKQEENGKQETTINKVHSSTSEIRQPIGNGAIAIRCGGQQITTRGRFEGNTAKFSCRKAQIRTIKISKSTVKYSYS